jgi:CDP-diacylglycerol---glycerol-3-phosphate 3-phosphatidyltransferase
MADTPLLSPEKPLGCFGLGWANAISMGRMGLAVVLLVLLLTGPSPTDYLVAFWGTIAVIWLDGVDGYVARKLGESSVAGAVVDILADRAVELLYWMAFAALGWVSIAVPMIVAVRGVWVDGLRALALQQGFTAFGQSSMMRSPVGVLLVSSRFSRWSYAVLKALAFAALVGVHGWGVPGG